MEVWHLLLSDPSLAEWSQHSAPLCKQAVWVLCFAHGKVERGLNKEVGALGAELEQRLFCSVLGQLCGANKLEASEATDRVSDSLLCHKCLCSLKCW